jgi:hypothetical protein
MRTGSRSSGICSVSRSQAGWRDTDGDNILDPLDMPPNVVISSHPPDTVCFGDPLIYSGTATVVPFDSPEPGQNDIQICRITAAQYRIDTGSWVGAIATDGAFNGYIENYNFTITGLALGTHTIEVRARQAYSTSFVWSTIYPSHTVTVVDFIPPSDETEFLLRHIKKYDTTSNEFIWPYGY